MLPGKYGKAFEEAMCDLIVAFTAWHKLRCVLQLLITVTKNYGSIFTMIASYCTDFRFQKNWKGC